MGILQEKFQTTAPDPGEKHEWASPESARRSKQSTSQRVSPERISGMRLNQLPPGDNVDDQQLFAGDSMDRVMADESDVTKVWSKGAIERGYVRRDVRPTDDAYTAEHRDTFYGEAEVDGDVGFAERGNTLDRI